MRAAGFLKGHAGIEASLLKAPPAHIMHLLDDSPELSSESKPELPDGLGYVVVIREQNED
jgi:hypothetical protein